MKNFGNTHHCSGSIIDETRILTAAHCVYNEEGKVQTGEDGDLSVLAGVDDVFNPRFKENRRWVNRTIATNGVSVHPKYKRYI